MKSVTILLIVCLVAFTGCQSLNKKQNPYIDSTVSERISFKKVNLPFTPGTQFKISQGAFGCCTHNISGYEYAWDFDVPYGTPVVAVEPGEVIQVFEPNTGGGCDRKFLDSAHNIKILHHDGTVAQYVHTQSRVKIGEIVKKNDVIAVTSNNGFHCEPQLHFNLFLNKNHIPESKSPKTIPTLFDNLPGNRLAHEGYIGTVPIPADLVEKIQFNLDLVRPWNKTEKNQFPTPLAAIFTKKGKTLIFVGDHHNDQIATVDHFKNALEKINPQIVVIENVDFNAGESPMKWAKKYLKKTNSELLNEGGLAPNAAMIAYKKKLPFIGGEASIEEQLQSTFLLSKGFTKEDILNVQILQRIPYRRENLHLTEDKFFKYAVKYYRISEDLRGFKIKFKKWYKDRTEREFNYATYSKENSDINCSEKDTYLQKVACAFNVNRDRMLLENIEKLFEKYDRVLVAYGTGHFVQEYPALIEAFGHDPQYLSPKKEQEF